MKQKIKSSYKKIIQNYNEAKNKVIIEGDEKQEQRADKFALNTMINEEVWKLIENSFNEENLLKNVENDGNVTKILQK